MEILIVVFSIQNSLSLICHNLNSRAPVQLKFHQNNFVLSITLLNFIHAVSPTRHLFINVSNKKTFILILDWQLVLIT